MLKLIIADDEPVICSLIRNLINWEDLGFEIVGTVYTGVDAFDLILKLHPDMVISDIRMPGYDGLELIRRTREAGLETEFVMISGFRQFEYAQTAMKYGVKYYLLKPIEEENLLQIANEIKGNIEKLQRKEAYQEKLEKQLAEDRDKMRRRFLSSMISEAPVSFPNSRDLVNQEYSTNFSEGNYRAVFVKVDVGKGPGNYLSSVLSHISQEIEDILDFGKEKITIEVHSGCITLFNYSADEDSRIRETIEQLYERCSLYLEQFEGMEPVIGVSIKGNDFFQSSQCIRTAIDAIKYRICIHDPIIYAESYSFEPYEPENLLFPEMKQGFLAQVETGDYKKLEELLRGEFRKLQFSGKNYSPVCYFDLVLIYANLFKEKCIEHDYYNKAMAEKLTELNMRIDSVKSIEELLKITLQYLKESVELMVEERRERSTRPVRVIREYLDKHYMEEINLNQLSELVEMNASYVSSIFKKETGMSYSEYLTDLRIEKAKGLLVDTSDSIEVIAEKVGYHQARYFSRQFSKMVGLKPFEYRKLYS